MNRPPIPDERVEVYQDKAAWLASRGGTRIGASEVAAILGVSPWRGPWDAWAERQGLQAPVDPARERTFARGHRYELRALQDFAEESGIYTCQPWAVWAPENRDAQVVVVAASEPWATCTPDGLTCRPTNSRAVRTPWGGAEAKTTSSPEKWGPTQEIPQWEEDVAAVLPAHYAVQCYWQLEVTGLPSWTLVCLLPWYEVRWYTLYRDPEIQRALVDAVGQWRERHLVRGEAPDLSGADACRRWLIRRFPGGAPRRDATDREAAMVRRLADLRALAKSVKEEAGCIRASLHASIGNARSVRLPHGGTYTPRRPGAVPQIQDVECDPLDFGDSLL